MPSRRVPPPARAYLWQVLGRIGLDDRRGVGVRDGLPDIDWVDVPAGDFQYGEEPRAVTLPAFRIARYPITNAQFQCFIDDAGFETDEWWQWPGWRRPPEPPGFPYPNHPRETVSWFDAMAFCRWLESRLRAGGTCPARRACDCRPSRSGRRRRAATMAGSIRGGRPSNRDGPTSTKPSDEAGPYYRGSDVSRWHLPGRGLAARRP